jgi:hypothetical protein
VSIAAEFGSGQVFWSILWFFVFVMWIFLLITIFTDIIRSHDMGGWAKAIWAIAIIFRLWAWLRLHSGTGTSRLARLTKCARRRGHRGDRTR